MIHYIKYVVKQDGSDYDSFDSLEKAEYVRDKYQNSERQWTIVKREIKESVMEEL